MQDTRAFFGIKTTSKAESFYIALKNLPDAEEISCTLFMAKGNLVCFIQNPYQISNFLVSSLV
jgi:hypothetical protein